MCTVLSMPSSLCEHQPAVCVYVCVCRGCIWHQCGDEPRERRPNAHHHVRIVKSRIAHMRTSASILSLLYHSCLITYIPNPD